MLNLKRLYATPLVAAPIVLVLAALTFANNQDSPSAEHTPHQESEVSEKAAPSLHSQIAELRAKVARLEAALELNHKASSRQPADAGAGGRSAQGMKMGKGKMKGQSASMGGMGMSEMGQMKGGKTEGAKSKMGMGMGMGMGMSGMKRMRMMGSMGGGTTDMPVAQPSYLPGFPGASHIYHIGSTSHFLDHSELFNPTPEQRKSLAQMLEQSALAQSEFERRIAQAEQDLWVLTSAGAPSAKKIEDQVKAIAQLQVEQRMKFIQSVGKAAEVLSDAQRKALVGDLGGQFDKDSTKKDAEHNH